MFKVGDNVVFHSTSDARLDDSTGRIVGIASEGYPIVLFSSTPEGYNPAIVISQYCIRRGEQ